MTPGTECVIRAVARADAGAIARVASELARQVRDPNPQLSVAYLEAQLFSAEPWAQCLVAELPLRSQVADVERFLNVRGVNTGRA